MKLREEVPRQNIDGFTEEEYLSNPLMCGGCRGDIPYDATIFEFDQGIAHGPCLEEVVSKGGTNVSNTQQTAAEYAKTKYVSIDGSSVNQINVPVETQMLEVMTNIILEETRRTINNQNRRRSKAKTFLAAAAIALGLGGLIGLSYYIHLANEKYQHEHVDRGHESIYVRTSSRRNTYVCFTPVGNHGKLEVFLDDKMSPKDQRDAVEAIRLHYDAYLGASQNGFYSQNIDQHSKIKLFVYQGRNINLGRSHINGDGKQTSIHLRLDDGSKTNTVPALFRELFTPALQGLSETNAKYFAKILAADSYWVNFNIGFRRGNTMAHLRANQF